MHDIVEHVETLLFNMVSLGRILTALMHSEANLPDPNDLAALGMMISREADNAREFIRDHCREQEGNCV